MMRVNLLPDRFKEAPFSVKQLMQFAIPALVVLMVIGLYLVMNYDIRTLEQEVRILENENNSMERVIREIRLHERRIQDTQNQISSILEVEQQVDWGDLIVELSYLVTDGIQIINFQLTPDKDVMIEGYVSEFPLITYFIYRLDNSPYFTNNVMKATDLISENGKEEFKIVGKLTKGEVR